MKQTCDTQHRRPAVCESILMTEPIPIKAAGPDERQVFIGHTRGKRADIVRLRWPGEWGTAEPVQMPSRRERINRWLAKFGGA